MAFAEKSILSIYKGSITNLLPVISTFNITLLTPKNVTMNRKHAISFGHFTSHNQHQVTVIVIFEDYMFGGYF